MSASPPPAPDDSPPQVIDAAGDAAFRDAARATRLDPDHPWIGGYVDYEWRHLRHILATYGFALRGRRVLEFGANIGASAIVMSHLGAQVQAVDVSERWLGLARLNALRHGHMGIGWHTVNARDGLPFADGAFDLINCNSVLEYVSPADLPAVRDELDRVLAPGGHLLVTGTSSRLWPREVHSGRWLVNYLPRRVDRWIFGRAVERGLWPWALRAGPWAAYENLDAQDGGRRLLAARRAIGADTPSLRAMVALGALLRIGPGLLAHNLSCALRKR